MINKIVSRARELAREYLKSLQIELLRDSMAEKRLIIEYHEKNTEKMTKLIAIREYAISTLDDKNPEKEDIIKQLNTEIDLLRKDIKSNNENIESLEKENEESRKDIEKWETGENKINLKDIHSSSNQMLLKYYQDQMNVETKKNS